MDDRRIIHVAPDLGYLFPATVETARVLCGRLATEVFAAGEFVGVPGALNRDCDICASCAIAYVKGKNECPKI